MTGTKTKPKTQKTIIVRKKLRSNYSPEDHTKIVTDYIGGLSVQELSTKYVLQPKTIYELITSHWEALTNIRETTLLSHPTVQGSNSHHKSYAYHALKQIQRSSSMNEKFIDELSDDESMTLSDREVKFALLLISTGNSKKALLDSGLDLGLIKGKTSRKSTGSKVDGWNLGITLRCEYLKQKPNVAAFINELRVQKYLPDAVDLQFIQRELLEQLEQAKEDDSMTAYNQKNMVKTLTEDLGRTIGAFSDRIQVESVNPAEALDLLAQLNSANPATPVLEMGTN